MNDNQTPDTITILDLIEAQLRGVLIVGGLAISVLAVRMLIQTL